VAQTRRRRRTKHRGNAAGVIESRGRTGRKPTAAEKKGAAATGARAKDRIAERRDRPPTWRGAFYRAMIAAVLLLVVAILLKVRAAVAYFPFALLVYTPISYYSDLWIYRRRQRAKAGPAGGRSGKA